MGSRKRQFGNTVVHSTLGKSAVTGALETCRNLCNREVRQRVEFTHSNEWVRKGLFPPETLKLAADAHRITSGTCDGYVDYNIGNDVRVRLNWSNTNMLAVRAEQMLPHVAGQSDWALYEHSPLQHLVPLMKARDKVQEICTKWQRARAVISELDQKATLGAFRYYLPAIMQLCSSDVPAEMPSRFNEPLWIGPWVPLIREAQETIAATALLPETDPPLRQGNVTFMVMPRVEHPNIHAPDVIVNHDRWEFYI